MKKKLNYNITVRGRVQGVGYRAFAYKIAKGMGLNGFVKNRPDGTVQIEVEGNKEVLDKFVILCKNGPGWAFVEKINLYESPIQEYQDFKIKY
ncbi:MAG: acylphosphatase [Cyclobacteriaceae bacterium]|nr:acylphosphatase [Cyclobacteriaceae bacterium]MCK5209978.1 acylphosphatase [Cyclobacteriaceae bacterium]MCK5367554.1 acylphosphatase [Cyclobacteriaceae bacterium]